MAQQIYQYDAQISIIKRATTIAAENVKQHINALHQKHEEATRWSNDTLQDQRVLLENCERSIQKFSDIPVHSGLRRLFRGIDSDTKRPASCDGNLTLRQLIDTNDLEETKRRARVVPDGLKARVSELEGSYEDVVQDGSELIDQFNSEFSTMTVNVKAAVSGLVEEIDVIVRKISSDYENILNISETPRTLATVSKTAFLHSRNFLPSLTETILDLDQSLSQVIERRNVVQDTALGLMQRISSVESALASIHPLMFNIDISDQDGAALDALSHLTHLPSIYASLLVEIVRRREWAEKMMSDSSTLVEEMAVNRDDEERRRKKWFKTVGDYLDRDALNSKALSIEVSANNQERTWPQVTRRNIEEYVASLKKAGGFDSVLREIEEWVRTLDAPSKQQVRRANAAFKNGSIHNATFNRNSLLLRGDDDLVQSLQNDKGKLEDRLRGSESRIRKLEDLLHRTSQIQKPVPIQRQASGLERHVTPPVSNHVSMGSSKTEVVSRPASVASRRVSANYGEDRGLIQRINQLESELAAEKAKTTQMQESASNHAKAKKELEVQVQEASSTKKDLMDNFEAQQHEFDGERRLLEDDNNKQKLRLEELEEELDHALGSHEQTKFGFDERIRVLEDEAKTARKESQQEVRSAQVYSSDLEHQLQEKEEQIFKLKSDIENQNEARLEHRKSLRSIHRLLADGDTVPEHFDSLVEAVEMLGQRAADHLRDMNVALDSARSDNESFEKRIKSQEGVIHNLQGLVAHEQKRANSLRVEAAANESRHQSVAKELESERRQLSELRTKFLDGETGSMALQSKLEKEERKFHEVSSQLGSARTMVEQSGLEAAAMQEKIEALQESRSASLLRLQDKANRAGEVSLQLFLQTDRLTRLLEHIGYNVSRQDDAMVIQRVSRSATTPVASSTTVDQSQSMNRIISGPVPPSSQDAPPEYIHWAMSEDDARERDDFEIFMHESRMFDLDAFGEAIIKRIKDTEHIARRWQKEAKAYREKFHRSQFDAQHKIAFRAFREGDLALFLPTRSQAPKRSWAAFNVGAPHYFLREQEHHKLQSRDYLLARISKVEERVVDLSSNVGSGPSAGEQPASKSDDGVSVDEENPFGLSDGLRWYFLDASEEKTGAPTTPGLGKTTVASANVEAEGSIQRKNNLNEGEATRTLAKSLDSRRSSANSKKGLAGATPAPSASAGLAEAAASGDGRNAEQQRSAQEDVLGQSFPSRASIPEEVRKDQLLDG